MSDVAIRNLAAAITLQAVKDFVSGTLKQQKTILKDLRSSRMNFITNGMSTVVAEQLELHPDEIAERLHRDVTDVV
jgi:hypothetical protein